MILQKLSLNKYSIDNGQQTYRKLKIKHSWAATEPTTFDFYQTNNIINAK